MDINQLTSLNAISDYRRTNARLSGALQRVGSGKRAESPREDPAIWGSINTLTTRTEKLRNFTDNLNRAATTVRVTLASMDASRAQLDQLDERLRTARAYPPGSDDRARALRDYDRLHPIINELADAPDPGAKRLLSDPKVFPPAGDLTIRAGEGGFNIVLRSREIHAGETGLDLPTVAELVADPANVSDAELAELIARMEGAKETLAARTKALAVDAAGITETIEFNQALIDRNTRQTDKLNVPDLNAESVAIQLLQVRSQLAIGGLTSLNESRNLLLQLLKT